MKMPDRHSETDEPELIHDPAEKAMAEARNALRQFDVGMVLLEHWLDSTDKKPHLRPSDLLTLNRFALDGVHRFAGTFRASDVVIHGSQHQPPKHVFVPELVEDFCDYVNSNWDKRGGTHLAAYALWRINWIHPFADGNGRTARIISYVILCAKLGFRLPGSNTIPDQIAANKEPYYQALESADREFLRGNISVSEIERLIEERLEVQLESAGEELEPEEAVGKTMEVVTPAELLELRMQSLEQSMRTYHEISHPLSPAVERNPVVFTGIFTIAAAVIGALIGWWLAS